MEIKERKLKGVYEITLKPNIDPRGFFMRTFDAEIFKDADIERNWVQENHSLSRGKGIIRGLHCQLPPKSETKLVRCINGAVFDVYVDLRRTSETFGEWDSIELSAENNKMVYIPRGFAHGFCTLTDCSEVVYKVDNTYSPENEIGILWNDSDIKIDWPTNTPILSVKDESNMLLREFMKTIGGISI